MLPCLLRLLLQRMQHFSQVSVHLVSNNSCRVAISSIWELLSSAMVRVKGYITSPEN